MQNLLGYKSKIMKSRSPGGRVGGEGMISEEQRA